VTGPRFSPLSYANAAVVALGLVFGAWGAQEHAAEVPAAHASPAGDHRAPAGQPAADRAAIAP
jgi:hypothetical protein